MLAGFSVRLNRDQKQSLPLQPTETFYESLFMLQVVA